MKTKKFNKKLVLKKSTVADLRKGEMNGILGGITAWKCQTYPELCDTYTECGTTQMEFCTDSACITAMC